MNLKKKVKHSKMQKTNISKINKKKKVSRVGKKKNEPTRGSAPRVRITRDMTIFQAMRMRPDVVEKLLNMGMGCGGCQFAMMETIEQGAMVHGLDAEKVLKEINK